MPIVSAVNKKFPNVMPVSTREMPFGHVLLEKL
jgi:hypothetical protein